ncbi:MAG TPA: bifunctional 3-phenylpropionate/cinnamic acid dioxygenase ferredoxin subunit [Ramlibacter sp.]|uniref:bifunctional 3-phenylpropionate/cinnamic acid dioxygenase ferredoxin subunit n=1 Tax=Ramlibacter sp. TaxID=1917967 RepID=UPI002B78442B|nr:bifunctional 3-phenylpropionate/cinnamic acid dioxygenase ferredoxin subunit [Ramlibacter sp.]HVZ45811.1 bifunctional 3-phenylpropionate/cinnamic acid dioxygenase ferredoxin subunit [Ramlibacter sp.]
MSSTAGELALCKTADVDEGGAVQVTVEGYKPFAVYRVEGEFYVSDDTCTHGEASLSEGSVEGAEVECPWHSGRFCLKTGTALTFPAVVAVRVYPVKVREDTIFINPDADQ